VITLDKLKPGKSGIVVGINTVGALRRRIIDMGITPGAKVIMKKKAPFGDPIEINVRGYNLSLRTSEAKEIEIEGG
jgi:ferrous iron transport protein A